MKYILLALVAIALTSSASSSNPWPGTEEVLTEVCRPKMGTYGANEYTKGDKICQWKLVRVKQ
jgi:hypothetical protein